MVIGQCIVKIQELPHAFKLEAVMCNLCGNSCALTPFESWNGTFECLAYALVLKQHHIKLDHKVVKCIFVRYNVEREDYCLQLHVGTKWILGSRDAVYVEYSSQAFLYCDVEHMAQSNDEIHSLIQPRYQPIDEVNVDDVVDEERRQIKS